LIDILVSRQNDDKPLWSILRLLVILTNNLFYVADEIIQPLSLRMPRLSIQVSS